ncbi:MAG TPA: DUF6113 family protein [Mycobacteriales bacterium]|nr:DUF6113 family protein [Mycobacteriales bacterium]
MRAAVVEVATYAVLTLLGAVLGVLGAFLSPAIPRVLGVPAPVGAVVALLGNAVGGVAAGRGGRGRSGAGALALGWAASAIGLGLVRPEGDLVVTNSAGGVAFLLSGVLGAAVAVAASGPGGRGPADQGPADQGPADRG